MSEPVPVSPDEGAVVLYDRAMQSLVHPDYDFNKLALEAKYRALGFTLVDKSDLVNVPHCIVGVTYREGYPREGVKGDYVSVEAVVASKDYLEAPPIKHRLPDPLRVYANQMVVYNDGSTGIRRQLTAIFNEMRLINVGAAKGDFNAYDKQYQLWDDGADEAMEGIYVDPDGEKFRYLVPMGLRVSQYEHPEFGDSTTYYLG